MVVLSALFGATAGAAGAALSATTPRLPTGPTVVLALGAVALVSILLAPARGVLFNLVRQARSRQRLRLEVVLSDLHRLADQHDSIAHGHPPGVLAAMVGGQAGVSRCLEELERRGLARRFEDGTWALTEEGHVEAERLDRGGGP
jgi:manganese/zinc/iron transport system permease protein